MTILFSSGASMLPTLKRFGLVRIKKKQYYEINDIISLKTLDQKFHIHRIVKIDSEKVSTKGDNLSQQWYEIDVPIRNIEGLLVWHYP